MKKENSKALKDVKSNYILEKISANIKLNKTLELIRYNKLLQKRLNKNSYDYKHYLSTEFELIMEYKSGKFININDNNKSSINIYLDNSKIESQKNAINSSDKIHKIKIMINRELKSFSGLFMDCKNIKKITVIKCYSNNIINMSSMFKGCVSLKEIILDKLITSEVIDISHMLSGFSSLR